MTSGVFQSTPVDSITVHRGARQRKELTDIEGLAASIRRVGLIHPVLIQRDSFELIAGERRLAAIKLLGWTHINTQFEDQVDPVELHGLELEENIKRVQLTWPEEVAAVDEYHNFKTSIDPLWTREKTAEALGLPSSDVTEKINVAKEIKANPRLADVPQFSTARGLVRRTVERRVAAQTAALPSLLPPEEVQINPDLPVINTDFLLWADEYTGEKFNLIHCDFPYGINADNMNQGNSRLEFGDYTDDPDLYWALLDKFVERFESFTDPSAHLVFWFSMKWYTETKIILSKNTDFIIDDFPLIWTKDKGLLPDPNRGPRRVYETAFFGRRGDRKIVRAKNNAVHAALGEREHMSQKAAPMLKHFFEMLVDNSTGIFDPTAGSGQALTVAEELGAARSLGLEVNPEFAERANKLILGARK